MAFNYSKIATLADSILADYGQAVTITRRVEGDYDPATGSVSIVETSQTGKAVVLDYGTGAIDGEMIQLGDKQLFLSVVGITTPEAGDLVTIGSKTRTITQVKDYSPAGTSVMLDCNLRG